MPRPCSTRSKARISSTHVRIRPLTKNQMARRVADVAEKRESFEGEKRAKLASGVLGLDMYKMREPLAAAGLKYID